MTELKIFKTKESERVKWVIKCKKTYRADNGDVAFIEGKRYPWRLASYCESDWTGCDVVPVGENGDCLLNTGELCEYFEGVYTSPVTKQGVVIAEDSYTTAIKELTGAILGMIGEEIGQEGGTDYLRAVHKVDGIVCYTITPEVNAAIQLAKKYQQLIEGKS